MSDIANLTLQINSEQAKSATTDLDKLDESGKRLGSTADIVRSGWLGMGTAIGLAAATVVSAFAVSIKSAIETQASYARLAEIAGTTAEVMSGMALPAKLAGTSLDTVAASIARLGREIGEARLGDKAKGNLLQALGINPDDGRDAAAVMVDVSRALIGMKDQTVAGKVANELLGRSYAELRPFMRDLIETGTEQGRVTNEQAAAAKQFEDGLVRLFFQIGLLKNSLANDFLPALNDIVAAMVRAHKEGGLFAAAIAGIQTALTGTDLHKANVEIFELTEKRMELEDRISKAQGTSAMASPIMQSAMKRLQKELDETISRLKIVTDYKGMLEDPGSITRTPASAAAAAAPSGPSAEEERVKRLMEDKRLYESRIATLQKFGEQYAAAIKTANTLADLAFREGGINNERTQQELIQQKAANDQANLQAQVAVLQEEKALSEGQGNDKAAAEAAGKIAIINSQIVENEVITQAQIRALRTETAQRQQAEYNAWQQGLEQQGASLVASFGSEAEITNKAYADKLAALEVYLAANRELITNDQALRERLETEHQAALGNASAQGALQRAALEKMTLSQQAEFYFGTLEKITAQAAQHNQAMFELNKLAAIANAVMSTATGMAKALEWGFPMGPIFAGIIGAAGAVNIATIMSSKFGGGGVAPSVGSAAGGATPTFQTNQQQAAPARAPSQTEVTINITGVVTQNVLDQIKDQLTEFFGSDGVLIPAASRQASVIATGI